MGNSTQFKLRLNTYKSEYCQAHPKLNMSTQTISSNLQAIKLHNILQKYNIICSLQYLCSKKQLKHTLNTWTTCVAPNPTICSQLKPHKIYLARSCFFRRSAILSVTSSLSTTCNSWYSGPCSSRAFATISGASKLTWNNKIIQAIEYTINLILVEASCRILLAIAN